MEPQTKPACECTIQELMFEIVRQAPETQDVKHAHFNQNRMIERDDDGHMVVGNLNIDTLIVVRETGD